MNKQRATLFAALTLALVVCAGCAQPAAPTMTPVAAAQAVATLPPTNTATAAMATLKPSDTPPPPTTQAASPTPTSTVQTVAAPTDTPTSTPTATPSVTPSATPTATVSLPAAPSAATGAAVWQEQSCLSCHGAAAQGDFGPKIAGTGLSFDQVLSRVRLGKGQMPAFSEADISDLALRHIYAWLRSLAPPTPTPIAAPTFPTQGLADMWYFVNEMRIRADFAKDLPVRIAQDDAGRLGVVKQYSGDGLAQTTQVLNAANRALNEVPQESVKQIIREVIAETNRVAELFNRANASGSYGEAWPLVAEAARICRIDTQPWATQAIRDAGLTGTVRVRVTDQAGRALSGVYATVLTSHTPLGARTDGNGWVSFVNVAAVPALPVKAYAAGRVYHEINVNLSPGATIEGSIALPPLPSGNVAPAVANPSISPASGPGNGVITLAVTATDPQGRLDLAEDQIFALNADLGLAYVLQHIGNDRYQAQVALPNLGAGVYTWQFFAVDHECHTSAIMPVTYRVP